MAYVAASIATVTFASFPRRWGINEMPTIEVILFLKKAFINNTWEKNLVQTVTPCIVLCLMYCFVTIALFCDQCIVLWQIYNAKVLSLTMVAASSLILVSETAWSAKTLTIQPMQSLAMKYGHWPLASMVNVTHFDLVMNHWKLPLQWNWSIWK